MFDRVKMMFPCFACCKSGDLSRNVNVCPPNSACCMFQFLARGSHFKTSFVNSCSIICTSCWKKDSPWSLCSFLCCCRLHCGWFRFWKDCNSGICALKEYIWESKYKKSITSNCWSVIAVNVFEIVVLLDIYYMSVHYKWKFCVISWFRLVWQVCLVLFQVHQETFGKSGCRRIVPGQFLAIDPKGRAVMVGKLESSASYIRNFINQIFVKQACER